jgi:ribonuclease-3
MAAKTPKTRQTRKAPKNPATDSLAPLESLLGHKFTDRTLLELALTHRSVAHERAQQSAAQSPVHITSEDNEQLEFLGDAVAGLLVADELYRRFPALDEGGLTRMRAFLVSRRHLGEVAARLQLGQYLRLGRGEEQTGGRDKSALLANVIEAIFAAVYIDAGLESVRRIIIEHLILPALDQLNSANHDHYTIGDHKSALQQRMQSAGLGMPRYVVTAESGPDHKKYFTVEVRMEKNGSTVVLGHAAAGTKKQAQQEAARIAFAHLDSLPQPEKSS